jgi:hypothetical protein
VAGLNYGRSDFLYWEDYELIEAAGNYQSFSDLKREGGELHRHLIGRELRSAVISAHPHFSNGFYVGLNGACYRSIPELIVGNLLCVNEVNYLHEAAYFPVGWKDVTKPLKPDFYFPELYAIFEVEMTKLANRGKMRENYVYRNLQKIEIYKQDLNLKFSFLNSEPFYSSRGFDIIGWVSAVRTSLREIGVLIKSIPSDLSKLLYEDISRKQFFLQSDRQLVIDCLVEELGINGIADLDNKHSSIKNLLCARGDEDEIRMVIKEIGLKRKSIRLTQFHQNRRDNYMSLEEVSVFCKKHKIKYVKDWNFFAVSNKELLRRSGIPSNLRDVYLARGEWISWSHAFTGIRDDVK